VWLAKLLAVMASFLVRFRAAADGSDDSLDVGDERGGVGRRRRRRKRKRKRIAAISPLSLSSSYLLSPSNLGQCHIPTGLSG